MSMSTASALYHGYSQVNKSKISHWYIMILQGHKV